MVGIESAILFLAIGQGVPSPMMSGEEWFYPADTQGAYIEKLLQADVVAIMRPIRRTFHEKRPLKDLATGEQPADGNVAADELQIVHCAVGGLSGTVRSLLLHAYTKFGIVDIVRPDPDPSANYLLIAKKAAADRVLFPELGRTPDDPQRQWSVEARNANEVAGFLLLRTSKSRVYPGEDLKETILVSAAEALQGATDKSARRISDFLASVVWPLAEPTRTSPGSVWMRENLASLVRSSLGSMTPYGRVRATGLLVRWEVPGSSESFLNELRQADAVGVTYDAPTDDFVIGTRFKYAPGQPSTDRLLEFSRSVSNAYLKRFAVVKMSNKPHSQGVQELLALLDSPDVQLRYGLLVKFAHWGNRPDLRPRWARGGTAIENEEELVNYWRQNPPKDPFSHSAALLRTIPRWLIRFFCAGSSSANVRPSSGTTKIGS